MGEQTESLLMRLLAGSRQQEVVDATHSPLRPSPHAKETIHQQQQRKQQQGQQGSNCMQKRKKKKTTNNNASTPTRRYRWSTNSKRKSVTRAPRRVLVLGGIPKHSVPCNASTFRREDFKTEKFEPSRATYNHYKEYQEDREDSAEHVEENPVIHDLCPTDHTQWEGQGRSVY